MTESQSPACGERPFAPRGRWWGHDRNGTALLSGRMGARASGVRTKGTRPMNRKTLLLCAAAGAGAMMALPAWAQNEPTPATGEVEELVVTGSRIPRIATEGPAPLTVIDSNQIRANGYASVPDLLRAVTQNGGETQSQQSFSGASFTPGAQQVDLRGLGPNHTLVLVNGRRIADFPLPFNGRSNFTDVSNIPLGMLGPGGNPQRQRLGHLRLRRHLGRSELQSEEEGRRNDRRFPLRRHRTRRRPVPAVDDLQRRFQGKLRRGVRDRTAEPAAVVGVQAFDPGLHRRPARRYRRGAPDLPAHRACRGCLCRSRRGYLRRPVRPEFRLDLLRLAAKLGTRRRRRSLLRLQHRHWATAPF